MTEQQALSVESKLPGVGETIFTTMSRLAQEHGAVNLSQGYPDFDVHPRLIELVHAFMLQGCNQYAPMPGVGLLRERIAAKVLRLYGGDYDPQDEITVSAGATEALFAAITAFVHPGDEVVVFEPAYDAYVPAVRLAGGRPVFVPLTWPGCGIDWEAVKCALSPRTRMIILNTPHNPTGAVLEPSDLEHLAELVEGSRIILLSDEVYEHIIFDGRSHASLAGHPELRRRSCVVSSFGKTYHATGWKTGYCLAPRALTAEFRKVHQYLTFAPVTPIQHAYAEILAEPALYEGLRAFYQRKRDLFAGLLETSRLRLLECRGTYFQLADYAAVSDEPDTVFARRLITEHGVAAIPTSVFFHDGSDRHVVRFCFAKQDTTLTQGAGILCRL